MSKDKTAEEVFPVDENDRDVMVTVETDEGDVDCEIVVIFPLDDQDYIVLLPVDENGEALDENLVYIYRYYEDAHGNPSLGNIETDEEYARVGRAFDALQDAAEQQAGK